MNLGSILGSISPAAGIASGGGLFGKLFHPHSQPGAAVPTPQPPAVQAPQPVAPPGPAAAPMGRQPMATPPVAPEQAGGLHGVAFGGKPNMQGILTALQMMAPGQRRF
jgi:hypothetical protein